MDSKNFLGCFTVSKRKFDVERTTSATTYRGQSICLLLVLNRSGDVGGNGRPRPKEIRSGLQAASAPLSRTNESWKMSRLDRLVDEMFSYQHCEQSVSRHVAQMVC